MPERLQQKAKTVRDPVAPAQRSASAQAKASSLQLPDGSSVHSWHTLLKELATLARNTCRTPGAGPDDPSFEITTQANPTQQNALDLIQNIRV